MYPYLVRQKSRTAQIRDALAGNFYSFASVFRLTRRWDDYVALSQGRYLASVSAIGLLLRRV